MRTDNLTNDVLLSRTTIATNRQIREKPGRTAEDAEDAERKEKLMIVISSFLFSPRDLYALCASVVLPGLSLEGRRL
jgi:hypothetical protein